MWMNYSYFLVLAGICGSINRAPFFVKLHLMCLLALDNTRVNSAKLKGDVRHASGILCLT